MATVQNQIVITANPKLPVQEINEIIGQMIRMWPGSEVDILKAVRNSIDESIPLFEEKQAEREQKN